MILTMLFMSLLTILMFITFPTSAQFKSPVGFFWTQKLMQLPLAVASEQVVLVMGHWQVNRVVMCMVNYSPHL